MKKVLYVSDLDGTLLRDDKRLSDFTVNTINSLVGKGMLFSYATARSLATASVVAKGLLPQIPVIVFNGTFILENGTGRMLKACYFEKRQAERILEILHQKSVHPVVFSHIGGIEKYSYDVRHAKTLQLFLEDHAGDVRENPVEKELLLQGDVFHFTCIDAVEKLKPLYKAFKDTCCCIFFKDRYSGEYWLEIQPKPANKGQGVVALKEMLGCDKVICFGDDRNDIPMFEAADERYAVRNAVDALKDIATGVIESNEQDGVAKWLAEHFA